MTLIAIGGVIVGLCGGLWLMALGDPGDPTEHDHGNGGRAAPPAK